MLGTYFRKPNSFYFLKENNISHVDNHRESVVDTYIREREIQIKSQQKQQLKTIRDIMILRVKFTTVIPGQKFRSNLERDRSQSGTGTIDLSGLRPNQRP